MAPAIDGKSLSNVTNAEKLSMDTSCSGPSATRPFTRSNESLAASGCDKVDRNKANTNFHSVWDLLQTVSFCHKLSNTYLPDNISVFLDQEDNSHDDLFGYRHSNIWGKTRKKI